MIDINLIAGVFQRFGAWGLIVLYGAWKLFMPVVKKRRGTWVSYSDLEKRVRKVEADMTALVADLKSVTLDFARFEARQDQINESTLMRLGQLHDSISALRETGDRHFAMVMDALGKIKLR